MSPSPLLPASEMAIVKVDLDVVPVSQKTTWLFLKVEFSNGTTGRGEASYFGHEPAVVADAVHLAEVAAKEKLTVFAPALDRFRTAGISQSMASLLSALEQAMLDAMAQSAKLPIGVLLGGNLRHSIPVYANINRGVIDRTPQGFATAALAAQKLGYQAIKLAPFDGLRWNETVPANQENLLLAGVERVAAVRAAVGDECRLLVDCHWRFERKLAQRAIAMLSEHKPLWVEDLVDTEEADSAELQQLRNLAHSHDILVAGGENVWTMKQALELLNKDGLDVMLPDLRQTGLLQARSILDAAAAQGVMTSLHNPAGPVLDAISVQMAASLPKFFILERQVNESPIYNALIETPIELQDGSLQVPTLPGLGVKISLSQLEIHSQSVGGGEGVPVSCGGGPNA